MMHIDRCVDFQLLEIYTYIYIYTDRCFSQMQQLCGKKSEVTDDCSACVYIIYLISVLSCVYKIHLRSFRRYLMYIQCRFCVPDAPTDVCACVCSVFVLRIDILVFFFSIYCLFSLLQHTKSDLRSLESKKLLCKEYFSYL